MMYGMISPKWKRKGSLVGDGTGLRQAVIAAKSCDGNSIHYGLRKFDVKGCTYYYLRNGEYMGGHECLKLQNISIYSKLFVVSLCAFEGLSRSTTDTSPD
jgi:hypothetical protein